MRLQHLLGAALLLTACQAPDPALPAGFAPFNAPAAHCLDASGSPGAGLRLANAACPAEPAWRIRMEGVDGARAMYAIIAGANTLCLEAPDTLGARVRMEPCNGHDTQRIRIDGFNAPPSAGQYDIVHTSPDSDLAAYAGLIFHAGAGCVSADPANGDVTLQPCIDPISGRFNPQAEWAMSPKPAAE